MLLKFLLLLSMRHRRITLIHIKKKLLKLRSKLILVNAYNKNQKNQCTDIERKWHIICVHE